MPIHLSAYWLRRHLMKMHGDGGGDSSGGAGGGGDDDDIDGGGGGLWEW